MDKQRVVVTGVGAVSPLGLTAKDSWAAVKAGTCGIGPITLFDSSQMKASVAAEVKGFLPEEHLEKQEARKLDRYCQFALAAAQEAVRASGLDFSGENFRRCGVIVSSGIGGLNALQVNAERGMQRGYDKVSPHFIPMVITNMAAGHIAIRFHLGGLCACPVAACAGGANAVGDAFRHIAGGYADVMVCGGAEAAITPLGIGGFTSMHALTMAQDPTRASIPFDAERSGFVMGEGAAMLVLESLDHAKARGAHILAELSGYGASCDAYHITAPCPDGSGGAAAMAMALADAGLRPEQVDYINAHGTSTPLNDACETKAIRACFGAHADKLAVSSTKSMTGHLLGASGALEAVFSVLSLADGFIPATVGYRVPDPECDLDIVPNVGRNQALGCVMSNSLGFGGHNISLIFQKWEA